MQLYALLAVESRHEIPPEIAQTGSPRGLSAQYAPYYRMHNRDMPQVTGVARRLCGIALGFVYSAGPRSPHDCWSSRILRCRPVFFHSIILIDSGQ
jgi:hypothetical protein